MTCRIHLDVGLPVAFVPEAPMDGRAYVRVNGEWAPIVRGVTHDFRVRAVGSTMNTAVRPGGVLQFDTVDIDSDGFAPKTSPFDHIAIPVGLGGIYVFTGWSTGHGTHATSLGMGVLINGINKFFVTNQTIWGPASVNYTLDNGAVEVLRLAEGDKLQLLNNSTAASSVFNDTVMAAARIEPGLQILAALARPT